MDLAVTQVVLGNLAAIGMGMSLEPYFGVYSTLGKSVFPDAYIAGISGCFSFRVLKDLPLFEKTPLSIPSMYYTTDPMISGGLEVLLNIPSGQVAVYAVHQHSMVIHYYQFQESGSEEFRFLQQVIDIFPE